MERDGTIVGIRLPRLYAIIDAEVLRARSVALREFADALRKGGTQLVQYRNKTGSPQEILWDAAVLRETFAGAEAKLLMNDRADLALLAGFDGVHVGQDDLSPADAGFVLGAGRLVGISTHTDEQMRVAHLSSADYVAIGPVFATETKTDAAAVVGLEGVRRARALTDKPLVAIGGITLANARSVLDAGADSVAVISALIAAGREGNAVVRDFLEVLG